MGRREVRRMLMGHRRPLWERRWFQVSVLGAILVLGLLIGLGVGRWWGGAPPQGQPAAKVEQPPAPVAVAEPPPVTAPDADADADDVRPLIQPPPPRPDPGSTEALELGRASEVVVVTRPAAQTASPAAAKLPPAGVAVWLRNALPSPKVAGRPMIAVIIDDLGVDRRRSERVAALKGPLTLSYMTYADELARQTHDARTHGHELMVHVPMQPQSASYDPGPEVLEVGLTPDEIRRRLDWGLSRFDGYVAINNHMGSRFTSEAAGMRVVMAELRRRGLAFVDSVTSERTVGPDVARQFGIPFATRHVFLDNDQGIAHVRAQLAKTEAHARKHGFAVAIGHPHDGTIEALAGWIAGLDAKGLVLVPISTIIKSAPNG